MPSRVAPVAGSVGSVVEGTLGREVVGGIVVVKGIVDVVVVVEVGMVVGMVVVGTVVVEVLVVVLVVVDVVTSGRVVVVVVGGTGTEVSSESQLFSGGSTKSKKLPSTHAVLVKVVPSAKSNAVTSIDTEAVEPLSMAPKSQVTIAPTSEHVP